MTPTPTATATSPRRRTGPRRRSGARTTTRSVASTARTRLTSRMKPRNRWTRRRPPPTPRMGTTPRRTRPGRSARVEPGVGAHAVDVAVDVDGAEQAVVRVVLREIPRPALRREQQQLPYVVRDAVDPQPLVLVGMGEQLGVVLAEPVGHLDVVLGERQVLVVLGHVKEREGAEAEEDVEVEVRRAGSGVL